MRVGLRTIAFGAALVLLSATGCRTSGLAFRADERVEITAPEQRSEVTLPFDLVWTVKDFNITGPDGTDLNDAGYFAVLVDTTPMPPGEDLRYYSRDDDSCLPAAGCPDQAYLNDRNVYLTRRTTFPVTAVTDTRPIDRQSAPDSHEVTIVLLNGKSERIGESSFRVQFTVDRGQDL
jgi:hypothetical protein